MLGRTLKQVGNRLYTLGATNGNSLKGKQQFEIRWSKQEEAVLRTHYRALGCSVLAQRFGRTAKSVTAKARKMGIATPKPWWCYADVYELLHDHAPARNYRLKSKRTAHAVSLLRRRLRKLYESGQLRAYLRKRPGAPAKLVDFGGRYPPGLRCAGARLTQKGKDKRAREYLAQEAERERQKAAFKKWKAQQSKRR
jgi:hypothetical protein